MILEILFVLGLLAVPPFAIWVAKGHVELMQLDGRAPSQGWQTAPRT